MVISQIILFFSSTETMFKWCYFDLPVDTGSNLNKFLYCKPLFTVRKKKNIFYNFIVRVESKTLFSSG